MSKHQLVFSDFIITDLERVSSMMSTKELAEHVKCNLAYQLAKVILTENLGVVTEHKDEQSFGTKYTLSLVVTTPDDYRELHNAVIRSGVQIITKDKVIPLSDLL